MPTYADYGDWVISIIAGWFEAIADRKHNRITLFAGPSRSLKAINQNGVGGHSKLASTDIKRISAINCIAQRTQKRGQRGHPGKSHAPAQVSERASSVSKRVSGIREWRETTQEPNGKPKT